MSPIVGVWANPLVRKAPNKRVNMVMVRIQIQIGVFGVLYRIQKNKVRFQSNIRSVSKFNLFQMMSTPEGQRFSHQRYFVNCPP